MSYAEADVPVLGGGMAADPKYKNQIWHMNEVFKRGLAHQNRKEQEHERGVA